jgi:FlaA1/EpsC-like NDP-sugar epimerase
VKEFRKFLLNNRITPKWVIFLLDLMLCMIAFAYANYQLTNLKIIFIDNKALVEGFITVALSSSLFFFSFKTYEGIIRFSEIHEVIRAMFAVFCSFFLMLLMNIALVLCKVPVYIPGSVLFVYFFCAAFIISGYRVLVKMLYSADLAEAETVPVIIYGAGTKGLSLQKTIGKISDTPYRVVAFIEDDETLIGKTVNNIRIYSYSQLESLLKLLRIKVLFFSTTSIDVAIKSHIVDKCLAHHIKIMNVPLLDGWMQSHLNSSILKEVKIEELLGRPPIQLYNPAVVNFLSNKNILITGAAGSIGSELARQIAAMNPGSLIICDQLETGLHDLEYELQKKHNLGGKLKFYLGDVKDVFAMEQLFNTYRPQIVFHAAAYKHVPIMENHPSEAIRNNVLGTKVVADLSEKYYVDRFLFISTDKAINPSNIMGASKRIAEMYCHSLQFDNDKISSDDPIVYRMSSPEHRTKFIITRFGNVLASNGSVIPRFREQIENGGPVTVTHPEVIRYFMTIHEACTLVLEAVTMGKGGEVLLFDMGEPVKILDLAKKMIMLAGHQPGRDIAITFTGLRPGEKLYEELLNKEEEVIPTHHKKILIAKTQQNNTTQMAADINKLIHLANACRDEEVVKQMKRILPQYISNNSVYELFDTFVKTNQPVVAQM